MFFTTRQKSKTENQPDLFNTQQTKDTPMMNSEVVMVSPDLAKTLLNKNLSNRTVRKGHVSSIANSMRRGEWMLSPQGVVVHNKTGRLLDGQHRLLGVVESNQTVPMLIIYVDDMDVFKVLDQGAKRSTGDIFNLDQRVADTVNFCCRLMLNSFGSLSPAQVEPVVNSTIGVLSQELIDYCGTGRKGFSSSPVKAAVVTSVFFGAEKDYAFSLYKNLILYDFDALPPVGKAFLRQLNTGSIDFSKNNGSKNTFARSLKLFDQKSKDTTVIRISESSFNSIIRDSSKKMKDLLILEGSLPADWGRNV
jgi:hypothetical protein